MKATDAARNGIARTFQNIALFKGMSTLDNIMTGRITLQKRNIFWQALWHGPAMKEDLEHREAVEQRIVRGRYRGRARYGFHLGSGGGAHRSGLPGRPAVRLRSQR